MIIVSYLLDCKHDEVTNRYKENAWEQCVVCFNIEAGVDIMSTGIMQLHFLQLRHLSRMLLERPFIPTRRLSISSRKEKKKTSACIACDRDELWIVDKFIHFYLSFVRALIIHGCFASFHTPYFYSPSDRFMPSKASTLEYWFRFFFFFLPFFLSFFYFIEEIKLFFVFSNSLYYCQITILFCDKKFIFHYSIKHFD